MPSSCFSLGWLFIMSCLLPAVSSSKAQPRPKNDESYTEDNMPKVYSWHIHVLFLNSNNRSKAEALKLLDNFKNTFKDKLGKNCTGFFHQKRLCLFPPGIRPAGGPFPTPGWAIHFENEDFGILVPWIMQRRKSLDILVHPNTGCEIKDHMLWGIWGGHPWKLNLEYFNHNEPFPWPDKLEYEDGFPPKAKNIKGKTEL